MFQILIVEDDRALNNSIREHLILNGYSAVSAYEADTAFSVLHRQPIDLILSDIMMPEIDGIEFASRVRNLSSTIPILFLTARDDFETKKLSYQTGIDEYLVKPIDLDELVLHIQALLRRSQMASQREISVGNVHLNVDETTLQIDGEDVPITFREFSLLRKFLTNPGKTFTRAQLMDEFWSIDTDSSPRTVDVYMTKLRNKLAKAEGFSIATVYGLGYKAGLK